MLLPFAATFLHLQRHIIKCPCMRKLLFMALVILNVQVFAQEHTVKWMTWEEAIEANKTTKKKIFIDLYTDWCGWCKVMDRNVFQDSTVAAYMNEHFYCVKFNAESKKDIQYQNVVFKYKPEYKAHDLAVSLLNGEMSYPSLVFLSEKEQRLTVIKGYQEKDVFLKNLKIVAEFKE